MFRTPLPTFGAPISTLAIQDPAMYFPAILPGWKWDEGPMTGTGSATSGDTTVEYRARVGAASKDTVGAVVEVITVGTPSEAVWLTEFAANSLSGATLEREGFLGDKSYEFYVPTENVWAVIWCRQHVVGLMIGTSRDGVYAWVEAADALFPMVEPGVSNTMLLALGAGIGLVALAYLLGR